jgi:hypothetical protein
MRLRGEALRAVAGSVAPNYSCAGRNIHTNNLISPDREEYCNRDEVIRNKAGRRNVDNLPGISDEQVGP